MLQRGSKKSGGSGRIGRTALLLLLAVVVFGSTARNGILENLYYDFLQQHQYKPASDQILLVQAKPIDDQAEDTWSSERFQKLAERLNAAGARLVVATIPLRFPQIPGDKQFAALEELERRALRSREQSSTANEFSGDMDSLTRQLQQFRDQFESRGKMAKQISAAGNVLLAAMVTDFGTADGSQPGDCSNHAVKFTNAQMNGIQEVRRIRYLIVPPPEICFAGLSIGYSNFWADNDGVIRQTELLLNANGIYYPSLSLAAASAAIAPASGPVMLAADETLSVGGRRIRTQPGFTILNRYYPEDSERQPFATMTADEVLSANFAKDRVKNRIVLLGPSSQSSQTGYVTPVADNMSPLVLVATSLSNLLDDDFLLRPDWAQLMQLVVMICVGMIALFWAPTLSSVGVVLAGLVIAVTLLSLETYLLVAMRIWVPLVTAAVFGAFAMWSMTLWRRFAEPAPAVTATPSERTLKTAKISHRDQLDLEFSVLRQQESTEDTKQRLYEVACAHIELREFAKGERVLNYLKNLEPGYRDVREKLQKLSGAPAPEPPKEKEKEKEMDTPEVTQAPPDNQASGKFRTLGRYEISNVLGKGAMATVYLGRDPKINRQVALKTIALAEEFDEEQLQEAKEQFLREAESAGRLNHPNIIAIYDVGEEGDVAYLAMEYFDGVALNDHSRPENLLPAKWVLELAARAADALDYAHKQNVVHRDIKPANLMYNAATDTLKLTDFGIARLTDSSRTKTGIILGTPSYMSPEQLGAEKVTGRTDLYSLGVTIYQLLVGFAPFKAESIPRLMDMIVNEKHRPLSEIKPELPPCVDPIVARLLAKDPEDRFQTGRALALVLRDCCKEFSG
jgi:serine/threonine-protein kinase